MQLEVSLVAAAIWVAFSYLLYRVASLSVAVWRRRRELNAAARCWPASLKLVQLDLSAAQEKAGQAGVARFNLALAERFRKAARGQRDSTLSKVFEIAEALAGERHAAADSLLREYVRQAAGNAAAEKPWAGVAMRLGLFGTVWGILQAFAQTDEAGDISKTMVLLGFALWTTLLGLAVSQVIELLVDKGFAPALMRLRAISTRAVHALEGEISFYRLQVVAAADRRTTARRSNSRAPAAATGPAKTGGGRQPVSPPDEPPACLAAGPPRPVPIDNPAPRTTPPPPSANGDGNFESAQP